MRQLRIIGNGSLVRDQGGADAKDPSSQAVSVAAAKGRFAMNIGTNVTYLALSVLVGMWFTPYLLEHLGVAAYGFVPLAATVIDYMSIVTLGFNSATARFLTIDLARGDRQTANRTFNTSLFGALFLAAALLPVAFALSYAAPRVFNLPAGREVDVSFLFLLVGLSFLIDVPGGCFAVSSFALSRFDLRNAIQAMRLVLRAGFVVALFALFSPSLWQVGLATLVASGVDQVAQVLVWRRLTPQLSISRASFTRSRLGELMGMGGWVIVNRVGSLLFLSIDLLVVNLIFGAEMAGRYGSILLFSTLLRRLASAMSAILDPVIMARYAKHDVVGMARLSRQAVKLMGLAIALPIGLLCGLARPLLLVWLGPSFQDLDILLIVLLGHLCINLAVLPLFALQPATNRVRVPGIVTLLMGVLNLGLAIAWARWGSWGAVGVAAAGAVVLTLKNTVFTPLYGARILGLRWWVFLPPLFAGLVATVAVGFLGYGATLLYTPDSWVALAGLGVVVSLIYGGIVLFGGLNKSDRQLLVQLVPIRLR